MSRSLTHRIQKKARSLRRAFLILDYEPLRPDFMDVAGGLSARTTGGGGTCCWILRVSGTLCGCEFFFFFEKSGISFFRFI
jgi:hypothetical protein